MNEVRFSYKPNIYIFILTTLLFIGFTAGLAYVAKTNEQGLILNRIIEFSVEGATIFYWCLASASAIFVLFGALLIIGGFTSKKEIILSGNSITAPKSGISKKTLTIHYSEVSDINIESVQKQNFLNIVHSNGKLTIPQSMLSSKHAFEELTEFIEKHVKG